MKCKPPHDYDFFNRSGWGMVPPGSATEYIWILDSHLEHSLPSPPTPGMTGTGKTRRR